MSRRLAALVVEAVDPQHPDALALLAEAALDLAALYPALFGPHLPPPGNLPALPRSAYLVAYHDGAPVGCGALRPIDALAGELQRIYVRPALRRRGVARALLAELEAGARRLGYRVLRLETGDNQGPARALYAKSGWRRIPGFGPYALDSTSVCFEKDLG